MKKRLLSFSLVISILFSFTTNTFAAPFDLTHNTDSTKNYTFNQLVDSPSVLDFIGRNLTNYQIEAANGNKYNAYEVNQMASIGITFIEIVAILDAKAAVVKAEGSKLQIDVDAAQLLISALPAGVDKSALQIRLDIVKASLPITPSAPLIFNDDNLNTVTGMASGMEYNLDGTGYKAYVQSTFDAINFAGDHTLLVRIAAAGVNPPSADTTLIFTSSVNEATEVAVATYEAAPIVNLAQIVIAEGLKANADSAVAVVADPTLKTAFEMRISAKTIAIANAKTAIESADLVAQAAAETAVAALEAAPLTNIAQINTATGLKATAETKVSAIQDVTAMAAFTARITTKVTSMAIAEITLQSYAPSIGPALVKYAPVLGLDFTDYNTLADQTAVLNALVTPVFTTIAEIKTVFYAAVATQKTLESSSIAAFNNATTAIEIETAISTYATDLSLGLTEYTALTAQNKVLVQTALLAPTFTTGEDIKIAFVIAVMNNTASTGVKTLLTTNAGLLGLGQNDYALLSTKSYIENAVIAAKPIADKLEIVVAAFNSTVLEGYVSVLINLNQSLLDLNLTDYKDLTFRNRMKVQAALMAATLTTKAEVQTTFDASVATQKAFEISAIAAFNNATNTAEVATAITTYINSADLGSYPGTVNKIPVQTALLSTDFSTLTEVQTALDAAVAAQKALETTAMAAINNAADASAMETALTTHQLTLGLNLTDYNALSNTDKAVVKTALITPTFYAISVIKTTFDGAVADQKAVVAVNTASEATMGTVITTNAVNLGLNISDYTLLMATSKDTVHVALVGKAFVNKAAVNTAFETAVALPIINEITTQEAMATAINRYASVLGLSLTDYGALYAPYNATVQSALIGKGFASAAEVKTAFDAAVALAKEAKAVAAINGASTTALIHTAITANAATLGLNLTDYNALVNKVVVQTAMLTPVFADKAEVKAAFDVAVAAQKAIEAPKLGTTGVTLNKTATYMLLGGTETLIATVLPEDLTDKSVTWTSSNPTRISVDSNGVMRGLAVGGPNIITVTTVDGFFTATCTVNAVTETAAIYQVTQLSIDYTAQNIPLYASALGLDLTVYNQLIDKYPVHAALFRGTFATAAALRAAFDAAVLEATPVPIAPDAPFWVTNDDIANSVDGMDVSMEYKLDGVGYVLYDPAIFSTIDLSGEHTLLVRVASDGFNPAGADLTLIFTTNPIIPDAPLVTNDDVANTVTGMGVGMEYDLDGAGYVAYDVDVFSAIDFSGDHILSVRIAADGINTAGYDTILVFTVNPAPLAAPVGRMTLDQSLIIPTIESQETVEPEVLIESEVITEPVDTIEN